MAIVITNSNTNSNSTSTSTSDSTSNVNKELKFHSLDELMQQGFSIDDIQAAVTAYKRQIDENVSRMKDEEARFAAEKLKRENDTKARNSANLNLFDKMRLRVASGNITAADVATMHQMYLLQLWGELDPAARAVVEYIINADVIDEGTKPVADMIKTVSPMVEKTGLKWNEILNHSSFTNILNKKNKKKSKEDETVKANVASASDIINSFLNSVNW